jgi:hypothetical protein
MEMFLFRKGTKGLFQSLVVGCVHGAFTYGEGFAVQIVAEIVSLREKCTSCAHPFLLTLMP